MRFRKLTNLALATAIAAAAFPITLASAATTAQVAPGMQVVDPSGNTVGTVTAVKGDALVLKTDKHEVQLPLTSFTAHEGKLLFGMTAIQLNAETEKAMAAADAAVTVGAQVYGLNGTLAGTIEALDDSLVTIKLTSGEAVRLPRSGIAGSEKGAVLGVTAAQLSELASQAGGSQDDGSATPDATPADTESATE